MKNVWIWNHYASDFFFEKGFRHYYFAKYLKEAGYNPTIFCASTLHYKGGAVDLGDKLYKDDVTDCGIPYVFIKTSDYKGNGFSRIKNMLRFAKNLKRVAKIKTAGEKPDVIYASSAHPFTCVIGILAAKKLKIPCIAEVRDLWPESIVAYKGTKKSNPIIWAMYRLEKWIYKKADRLVFTMEGGADYICEKGWDKEIDMSKVTHINNGVDLQTFDDQAEEFKFDDSDLKNPDLFKVVYTGSVRVANGIDTILDTAKYIEKENPNIRFLIWGDGDELPRLQQRVLEENISNASFKGRVDKKYVASILRGADININVIVRDFFIFKYGGSQNKLFDYFASRKPIVSVIQMNYDLMLKYGAGIIARSHDPQVVADAILKIAQMPSDEFEQMSANARTAAQDHDYKVLTDKLISILEGL